MYPLLGNFDVLATVIVVTLLVCEAVEESDDLLCLSVINHNVNSCGCAIVGTESQQVDAMSVRLSGHLDAVALLYLLGYMS
jgi:hypothetical protein